MRTARRNLGLLVFACALLLRIGWVQLDWLRGGAALQFPDETLHWQLATNLVSHGQMRSDDGRYAPRMPLYQVLLAPAAALGETWGVLAARLLQALCGAATAWLVFIFARVATSEPAAIAAGMLAALDPFALYLTKLLLSETLFTLAALLFAYWTWLALRRRGGVRPTLLCGLALLGPILVLTRQSALGWVLLSGLWVVCRAPSAAAGARRAALLASAFVLLLLPWGLRNRAVIGDFAWLSANSGLTLYDALGPQADGSSNQSFLATMPELASLGETQRDRELQRRALAAAWNDPERVLALAPTKFLRTWSLTPNADGFRAGPQALLSAAFMLIVLAAATVGLWCLRRERLLLGVLLLPVVYFTLLHCVYIGSVRYRAPIMPLVEILASASLLALAASPPRRQADQPAQR